MTSLNSRRLTAVLIANGLLLVAASAGGALVGFYLAALALASGGSDERQRTFVFRPSSFVTK